ncbi:hypothetical protein RhiirA4_424476 [Rhizophagus irregularis]|uniref:Tc1-like transposase DDE domain-containing protein n=1 Tax=Rhizophagus irregularis TaxID=588596 RepID=A0A2I1GXM3_9GLOM|nr:hypothetical protein RhiirA4_424476 [Rhizophagus irregularis]
MPRKKKIAKAAKIRVKLRIRNLNTGQLVLNDDDDEYMPSSDYSEDSSDDEYIDERIKNLGNSFLIWSSNAHSKLKKSYTGNSRATKFKKYGPSGTFTKAAKSSQPITNFFHKSQEVFGELKNRSDDEIEDERNELEDRRNNDKIEYEGDDCKLEEKDNDDDDELEDDYNNELEDKDDDDELEDKDNDDELEDKDGDDELEDKDSDDELEDKDGDDELEDKDDDDTGNEKQASLHSAKVVYNKGSYKAKQIRIWAKSWLEHGILPKSLQERHQKIKSIIDDEDAIEQSLLFIREKGGKTTPKEYQTFVKEKLFSHLGIEESKKSISIKTSCVWLKKLGLAPQPRKKGIYFDGHEREDVVEYRNEFLDKMLIYEKFMPIFEGENMEQKDLVLLSNEKLHILITHDECLFYANDDRPIVWAPIGEPPLRKKGQGKSIMVSDFLLETDGRLKLNENEILLHPEVPIEARKFLKPGKNEEGWWTAEHLLNQVINYAIPIFEANHPNAIGVFTFDNSTNHGAMAKDALNVNNMNINPGGKQAIMKSTFFGPDNTFQSMVFPSNHPTFPNQPKEEDFKSQKSQLQEEIEKRGHICIFYPKYHCELNYIEMYWGAAKRYTRENCNYTWSSLQKTVPEALDSIPLITIRKFARKSWRYMDIYRKGITGKVA